MSDENKTKAEKTQTSSSGATSSGGSSTSSSAPEGSASTNSTTKASASTNSTAKTSSATTGSATASDDNLVWNKDQIKQEIVQVENQLSVAIKYHINRITSDGQKLEYELTKEQPVVLPKAVVAPNAKTNADATEPAATPATTSTASSSATPNFTLTIPPTFASTVTLEIAPAKTVKTKPTSETDAAKTNDSDASKTKPKVETPAEPVADKPATEPPLTPAEEVESELLDINEKFQKQDLLGAQNGLIEVKNKLHVLISRLPLRSRMGYFASTWGVVPLSTAALALFMSLIGFVLSKNMVILGIIPLWAAWAAVLGSSVQIFVGVVGDYKDDGMVTEYKRLWYLVVPLVSFAFGILAFLLVQAGFFDISGGTITLNQALNQTITTTIQASTNQTVSQTMSQSATTALAVPFIICFLVGYSTDWFIATLGKLTHTDTTKK